MMRAELGHACVLDADFFAEKRGFCLQPIVLGGQPNSGVDAVGGPAAGMCRCELRQRDDVEDGGFDGFRPALGQRDLFLWFSFGHSRLARFVYAR
jgi:hypothetical protein